MPDSCCALPTRAPRQSDTQRSPFATTRASLTVNANLLVHREVILSFFPFFFPSFPTVSTLTRPDAPYRLNSYFHPFPLSPPSLFLPLCFPLCTLLSPIALPLAFLSVTETTDDRVSGRIFPMAVIAHAGETRLSHGELPLPFDGIVMRSSFSSRQISKFAAESCCIGAWGGESRID